LQREVVECKTAPVEEQPERGAGPGAAERRVALDGDAAGGALDGNARADRDREGRWPG
jgi:hypothetical protein